jgi:probable HAF family extracellular repeat protein
MRIAPSRFPSPFVALALALAALGGCKDTVQPEDPGPLRVEITPAADTVYAGRTLTLSAALYRADGSPWTGTVIWTSSDTSLVKVAGGQAATVAGAALAAPRDVRITATAGQDSGTAVLTVVPRPVAGYLEGPKAMVAGRAYSARALYAATTTWPTPYAPAAKVTWLSTNPSVVSVAPDGALLARAAGQASIVASTSERSDTLAVRVMASGYAVTFLGALGGGHSTALDVNDAGVVVGNSSTAAGDTVAFVWKAGSMTALARPRFPRNSGSALIDALGRVVGTPELPNPAGRVLTAVSDAGTVAGYWGAVASDGLSFADSAFAIHAGVTRTLPGTASCGRLGSPLPVEVNDAGDVVGSGTNFTVGTCFYAVDAVFWPAAGGPPSLHFNGYMGLPSAATAVNNRGDYIYWTICRFCEKYISAHGFLVSNGQETPLGRLIVAGEEYPMDLNEAGVVAGSAQVGTAANGLAVHHGFISQNGTMLDLSALAANADWEILNANGINESGVIVGYGVNHRTGQSGAVLLTPP